MTKEELLEKIEQLETKNHHLMFLDKEAKKETRAIKKDYHKLSNLFNALVAEHNELVDKHNASLDGNQLIKDNRALIQFIVSLSRGLAYYAEGGYVFRDGTTLRLLNLEGEVHLDAGRMFCADMYNEIITVLIAAQTGKSFEVVYEEWIKKCNQLNKGGIIQ